MAHEDEEPAPQEASAEDEEEETVAVGFAHMPAMPQMELPQLMGDAGQPNLM